MDFNNGSTPPVNIVFYYGRTELARSPLVEDSIEDLLDTCAFIAGGWRDWGIDEEDITWELVARPPLFGSTGR